MATTRGRHACIAGALAGICMAVSLTAFAQDGSMAQGPGGIPQWMWELLAGHGLLGPAAGAYLGWQAVKRLGDGFAFKHEHKVSLDKKSYALLRAWAEAAGAHVAGDDDEAKS